MSSGNAGIGAALPGASWQRRRSHYLCNLLTKVPRSCLNRSSVALICLPSVR